MSGERPAVLRRMLEDLREETLSMLRARATHVVDPAEVMDSIDRGVDESLKDMELTLAEGDRKTLHAIEDALASLHLGRYGVCSECGGEIAEARLKALPFATLCHACQSGEEASRGGLPAPKPAGRRRARRHGSPSHADIAQRAHQIYESRGFADGKAVSDWLQAERELKDDDSEGDS
jgi:DnaK suppressor protein